jgi:hypothetical protein
MLTLHNLVYNPLGCAISGETVSPRILLHIPRFSVYVWVLVDRYPTYLHSVSGYPVSLIVTYL